MILLYTENKKTLELLIKYIDNYTTDLESDFNIVLFDSIKASIIENIKKFKAQNKKIVFLMYEEEEKIYINSKLHNKNSIAYINKIKEIIELSDLQVTSLKYFKNLFKCENIIVIPKEIKEVSIFKNKTQLLKKYNIKPRKKKILILDFDYHYLNYVVALHELYPKVEIYYMGLKPTYLLSSKDKILKEKLSNINFIYSIDTYTITDFIEICDFIINFEELLDIQIFYIIFMLKKEIISKKILLYEDYLINSKNIYTFTSIDEMLKKIKKIEYERLANLTNNAYDLLNDSSYKSIKHKFNEIGDL